MVVKLLDTVALRIQTLTDGRVAGDVFGKFAAPGMDGASTLLCVPGVPCGSCRGGREVSRKGKKKKQKKREKTNVGVDYHLNRGRVTYLPW